jgi:hypothetical protein
MTGVGSFHRYHPPYHLGAAFETIASKHVMEKIGIRYLGLEDDGGQAFTLSKA